MESGGVMLSAKWYQKYVGQGRSALSTRPGGGVSMEGRGENKNIPSSLSHQSAWQERSVDLVHFLRYANAR